LANPAARPQPGFLLGAQVADPRILPPSPKCREDGAIRTSACGTPHDFSTSLAGRRRERGGVSVGLVRDPFVPRTDILECRMRAALNMLLVSSGFAVIFLGIAVVSALLTATVHSQLYVPKLAPIGATN
jgi:hypothetical protein